MLPKPSQAVGTVYRSVALSVPRCRRIVIASEIEPEALADFRLNDFGDRLALQVRKTKSLPDDKLRNASMRRGVQREVSKILHVHACEATPAWSTIMILPSTHSRRDPAE